MIADLIAIGVFSSSRYTVPASRSISLALARTPVFLPPKYPNELLPYQVDWSMRLDGSTIKAMVVTTVEGTAGPSRAIFDATTTSFWLGGGTSENASIASVLLTTNLGEQIEEFFNIRCL